MDDNGQSFAGPETLGSASTVPVPASGPAAYRAAGVSGLLHTGGYIIDELSPNLTGLAGKRIWRQMIEDDALNGALLFAIEMLIRQAGWQIEDGSPDPADAAAGERVRQAWERMIVGWQDTLSQALSFVGYGFAPLEIVYRQLADGGVGWHSWQIRNQDTVWQWEFDDQGMPSAIVQRASPTWQPTAIPVEKLLIFRTSMYRGNPEGLSVFRNCYRVWTYRRNMETIEAIGEERNLAGLPVFYLPARWLQPTATDEEKAIVAQFEEVGANLRRDEQACVIVPTMYDANGNKLIDFQLATGGRGGGVPSTDPIIARYGQQQLMRALADVIMLGHENVGSYALGQAKTGLFTAAVTSWADMIAEVVNRDAIPRLLALNGLEPDNPPRLTHGPLERVELATLATAIKTLTDAGFTFDTSSDGALMRRILDDAELPEPPEVAAAGPPAAEPAAPTAQTTTAAEETDRQPQEERERIAEEQAAEWQRLLDEMLTAGTAAAVLRSS